MAAQPLIIAARLLERGGADTSLVHILLQDVTGDEPVLLVDLGVPRNFDAAARAVEGAYLCDLDDLSAVANINLQARLAEVARARTALTEKAARVWGATQRPATGTP